MDGMSKRTARRAAVSGVLAALSLGVVAAAAGAATLLTHPSTADKHSTLPPEKQAAENAYKKLDAQLADLAADAQRRDAVVAAKAADKKKMAAKMSAAASTPETPWPEGIFDDGEAPAPGSTFLGQNRWVGTLDGDSVAVYAGQAGLDATAGRVLVRFQDATATGGSGYTLDLPGSGPLTIVGASGAMVTVVDSQQSRHVLDLVARAWTS